MAATLSDIQLNIIVNVRNAASINALNATLAGIATRQASMARAATASAAATQKQATAMGGLKNRLDGVEQNFDALFRASYRLMNVGYQLIGVAKGIVTTVTDMTDAWGKFEFTLNRAAGALQIWRGSGETINPLYESLIQNILSASKELRLFPAEEVAKATYFWGSTTGQTVRTLGDLRVVMEAITPLMQVAALTQTSYEQAIKGTYSLIVQYGKSLSDVDDVTSKLFLVTQRTALEFGDLVQSFKYVGPTAHALGITFEEVAQVLGALGDAGIRGSQSGRALRQMFIRLVKPPAEAAKALDALFMNTASLGKTFDELVFPNGKFIGITGYINLMATALKNATVAQRNHIYAISSTANELPVITALVENQIKVLNGQAGAYDNAKASVDDAANAALQFKKNWDLLSQSWVGLTGRIQRGIEIIKIQVGRVLAGALAESVNRLAEFLDRIEGWVRRNPAIVRQIGQLGAALAAVAGIAGGMFLLSGALLGVYAAVNVIVRGFGPLAGTAGAVLGIIVVFAESIIDNWTRVQRVVVPAINRFAAALGGTGGTVDGIRTEWERLHETFRIVVDFIVKQVTNAFKILFDFMTMIANSPLRPVIEALGQALVVAFGLRTLAYVTKFASAISGLLKLFMIVKAQAVLTGIQLRVMGVASLFAANGAKGLTLALQTMSRTTVLLILTGIVFVVQQLIDALPKASQSLEDLRDTMADFYVGLGERATQWLQSTLDAASGAGSAFRKLAADVQVLKDANKFDPAAGWIQDIFNFGPGGQVSELQATADAAEQVWLNYQDHVRGIWQGIAVDTDRSVSDIAGFVERFGTRLFGNLSKNDPNLDRASAAARAYFESLKDGTELTADGAVAMWNKLIGAGVIDRTRQSTGAKEAFLKTFLSRQEIERVGNEAIAAVEVQKAKIALAAGNFGVAYRILNALRVDAAKYGDDFNATVTSMLGGIPEATAQVLQDAVGLMDKTPGEMLDALVTAFKNVGNISKRFKAALKNKIKTQDLVDAIVGDIKSSEVQQALTSKNLSLNLWGQQVLDNAYTSFTTAVAAYSGDKTQTARLAAAVEKAIGPSKIRQIVSGTFKGKWWGKLTVEQQEQFQNMADWWAAQIGLTTPSGPVIATAQRKFAEGMGRLFHERDGETPETTETDPLAGIVAKMRVSVDKGTAAVDGFKEHITAELTGWAVNGKSPMDEYASGLLRGLQTGVVPVIDQTTSYISGHLIGRSPPPLGPLRNITEGGVRTMMAWATGALAAMPLILLSLVRIGNNVTRVMSPPSIDLYSGGYRVMNSWIRGMRDSWTYRGLPMLTRVLIQAKARLIGESPPPEGPLRTIDTGGYNVMKAWADGIMLGGNEAARAATATAARVHEALNIGEPGSGSTISYAASNERHIKVDIDVSSKDGSVSAVDMSALRESLVPELVRSLEKAAAT